MTTQSDRGLKLEPCPFCGVIPVLLSTGLVRCKSVGPYGRPCPVMLCEPCEWNARPVPVTAEVSEGMVEAACAIMDADALNGGAWTPRRCMRAAISAALKAQRGVGG